MHILDFMKKKAFFRYNKWIDHLRNTKERTNYAIQRLDLLIISISGAGIYIIFETLREFKTGNISIENNALLFGSGLAFLLAIVSNFISQHTGYNANIQEEHFTYFELSKLEGEDVDERQQAIHNHKGERYSVYTKWLNKVSTILMLIGLALLTFFNFLLF